MLKEEVEEGWSVNHTEIARGKVTLVLHQWKSPRGSTWQWQAAFVESYRHVNEKTGEKRRVFQVVKAWLCLHRAGYVLLAQSACKMHSRKTAVLSSGQVSRETFATVRQYELGKGGVEISPLEEGQERVTESRY